MIHTRHLDVNYCTFLAALRTEGGLLEERPMDNTAFMEHRAAVERASSARSSTLGTTSAASTPMMTSTTISSISVKPR